MYPNYLFRRPGYKRRPGNSEGKCRFCQLLKENNWSIIFKNDKVFSVVNTHPYNEGHILLLPVRHVVDPRELTQEETIEFYRVMNWLLDILQKVYDTNSFNIGFNLGNASGATYQHLHLHIIPRWLGDTGFVEATSMTKVLKESPKETRDKLVEAIKESLGEKS